MSISREELEVIHKEIENGGKAKIALEVLDSVINEIIENSKNEFAKISLANYQKNDNNYIWMLLSHIEVAKKIQNLIRMRIDNGERAADKLINGE